MHTGCIRGWQPKRIKIIFSLFFNFFQLFHLCYVAKEPEPLRVYAFMQMNFGSRLYNPRNSSPYFLSLPKKQKFKKNAKKCLFWSQVIFGLLDCLEQDELEPMVCRFCASSMCHASTQSWSHLGHVLRTCRDWNVLFFQKRKSIFYKLQNSIDLNNAERSGAPL